MKFKEPKTIEEQIQYLKEDKRVVFNDISEIEAKEILTKYGYINVISPFKYHFAEKDKSGNVLKINNRHVYNRDVDFNEYYDRYKRERSNYPIIYQNISEFECTFNSIISYECIHYYNIYDFSQFQLFVNNLISNLYNLTCNQKMKDHYLSILTGLTLKMNEYKSIYILLDRLTLNETFTIFKCCDQKLKSSIFRKLLKNNCTFNETRISGFEKKFPKLVLIRNYVFHNNSLTILTRYYKVGTKELRKINDRKEITKLISLFSSK